jgi:hypothetical protein
VGYGPSSLCLIHKEGLCPSSGDINRLMLMMKINIHISSFTSVSERLLIKYIESFSKHINLK